MDKKYDHHLREKEVQALWAQENTYKANNNPGPLFSIDTPPPTVSGSLHIGHIFSYTQTDILARYKRMNGFSVFYPFGFDDNGLPTERYVEKQRGVSSYALGRSAFIEVCLQETKGVEEHFKQLWQKMGLSVDWDACYSTISDKVRKISQESFIRLYKKGFIYRHYEPALYCTTCRTSVAQAELDDVQKSSFFNDIIFTLVDDNSPLVIGTTRPELLSSCVALLYHPSDKRYQHLAGKHAKVPVFNTTVPILADELVDPDKGTGLVMCCTFGDKNDIAWYKKHNLPFKQSIGQDGRWTPQTGILAGLKVQEARAKILEALKENSALQQQKPITHAVNVHERCKHEIEYLPLSQWFLNILDHKTKFIELADKIEWYPTFMKQRYINWVENISWNWCLSRQRFFGIPFPVWHCQDCKTILLAEIKQLPIDPQETHFQGNCTHCKSTNIVADTDVMDTWNTSSLTPYICYTEFDQSVESPFEQKALEKFIPMSMRPQAHDIIRTWAFYTIVKTWMHHETIPWKTIVISGHVLSDSKEKLSKSKENSKTNPDQLLKLYSADAIRYWTASGGLGQDTAFSEQQILIGQRLITKLWNAFSFISQHCTNQQPLVPTDLAHLDTVNEWILHTASECFEQYKNYFEQSEFSLALDTVEKFFWHNFCDNYLELIKDQLFKPEKYSAQHVATTKKVLYHVGLQLLQLYAPFLPHVTETIYVELYKQAVKSISLHQTRFSTIQLNTWAPNSKEVMVHIISLISAVRKLKSEHQLSLKTEISVLKIATLPTIWALLQQHETLIKGITQAHALEYIPQAEKTTLINVNNTLEMIILLTL